MAIRLGGGAVDSGKTFAGDSPAAFNHFTGYNEFFDPFLGRKGLLSQEQLSRIISGRGPTFSKRLSGDRLSASHAFSGRYRSQTFWCA